MYSLENIVVQNADLAANAKLSLGPTVNPTLLNFWAPQTRRIKALFKRIALARKAAREGRY